jgi:hypothetical protein
VRVTVLKIYGCEEEQLDGLFPVQNLIIVDG